MMLIVPWAGFRDVSRGMAPWKRASCTAEEPTDPEDPLTRGQLVAMQESRLLGGKLPRTMTKSPFPTPPLRSIVDAVRSPTPHAAT